MSESRFRAHPRGWRLRRALAGATTLVLASLALAACQSDTPSSSDAAPEPGASSTSAAPDPVELTR